MARPVRAVLQQAPKRRWRNLANDRIKEECLDHLIPMGERHFRRAVTEYGAHDYGGRNHHGLDNRLISRPPAIHMTNRVRRRPRLGGWLNVYDRAA